MSSLKPQYPLYFSGTFTESGEWLDVTEPFNDKLLTRVSLTTPEIYERAVQAALDCRKVLHRLSSGERSDGLARISMEIFRRREEFIESICRESGKPWKYAAGETDRGIETFRIASEEARRLPGEYISLDWTAPGKGREGVVKYFPAGVVAGITPFNFPLNLVAHKVAPALASGCPIIIKPASKTPVTSLLLAEVIDEAGFPPGAFSVLPMSRKVGDKLVTDPRFAVLSFTGSPEIGWDMKARSGKKKAVLELGGNAGVIVSESTTLSTALPKCVTGAFAYSGQICIHAQRMFVSSIIFREFIEGFIRLTATLKEGDPMDPLTDVSRMIDLSNAERVESWVNEAVNAGARVLIGGKREGSYYPPTILTETTASMKVCSEEIFGPVVTIDSYSDFKEAVERVNDTRFGLQTGVFTNSVTEMDYAFENLEVGGVILNDVPTLRFDQMPYGGVKDSGFGREGVKYAILDYMEPRILVK